MLRFLVSGLCMVLVLVSLAWGRVGGGDITFSVSGAANVVYSHDEHFTKFKITCSSCHYRIFTTVAQHKKATMEDMQNGHSCGACHNGTSAFDVKGNCIKCHA